MLHRNKTDRIVDYLITAFLILVGVTALLPLVNTLAISLSDKAAVSGGMVGLIPVGFNLDAYGFILRDDKFWQAFGVSVLRVLLGGALNFVLAVLTAFPLSRSVQRFPARNVFMWLFVFGMILNVGIVPWYLTISGYRLLDSIWALVLPGAVPIWSVILLMNFFRSIPKELDEAARMDGANPWQLLWSIYLPTSLPAPGDHHPFQHRRALERFLRRADPDEQSRQLPLADLHPAVGDRRPACAPRRPRPRSLPSFPTTRSTRPSSLWR
jgi:putative aldouronate transport system permease protein